MAVYFTTMMHNHDCIAATNYDTNEKTVADDEQYQLDEVHKVCILHP